MDDGSDPCNAAAHAEGSSTAASRTFSMRSLLPLLLLCTSSEGNPTFRENPPAAGEAPAAPTVSDAEYLPYGIVGGWSIVVELRDRPSCLVLGRFASGTVMRIGIDREGAPSAYAVVSNPSWRDIAPDRDYRIDVTFGSTRARPMSARSGSSGSTPSLTIRLDDVATARSLATTTAMTIDREGRRLAKLPLASTADAIAAMAVCQTEIDTVVSAIEDDGSDDDQSTRRSDIA